MSCPQRQRCRTLRHAREQRGRPGAGSDGPGAGSDGSPSSSSYDSPRGRRAAASPRDRAKSHAKNQGRVD